MKTSLKTIRSSIAGPTPPSSPKAKVKMFYDMELRDFADRIIKCCKNVENRLHKHFGRREKQNVAKTFDCKATLAAKQRQNNSKNDVL
jgi:hypothetical protein